MISLEQIRLLEGKISRAIELIRVLKDENATLRRGLDSAQKRMKELESLVDGLKADQKEIESVIVRTLRHLDDLDEGAAAGAVSTDGAAPVEKSPAARPVPVAAQVSPPAALAGARPQAASGHIPEKRAAPLEGTEKRAGGPPKDELDIF